MNMAARLYARIKLRRGLSTDPNSPSNFSTSGVPLLSAEMGYEIDRRGFPQVGLHRFYGVVHVQEARW